MKFVHVMIRVKDIDASMRFYTELLDMNRTGEVVLDDCTLYYLSDEDGQTQITTRKHLKTDIKTVTHSDTLLLKQILWKNFQKECSQWVMNTFMNLISCRKLICILRF